MKKNNEIQTLQINDQKKDQEIRDLKQQLAELSEKKIKEKQKKICNPDFSQYFSFHNPEMYKLLKERKSLFVNDYNEVIKKLDQEIFIFQTEVEKFHSDNLQLFEQLIAQVKEVIESLYPQSIVNKLRMIKKLNFFIKR